MSEALFIIARKKQNKNTIIIIKGSIGSRKLFFNKISFFKYVPLYKIFTFAMIF